MIKFRDFKSTTRNYCPKLQVGIYMILRADGLKDISVYKGNVIGEEAANVMTYSLPLF